MAVESDACKCPFNKVVGENNKIQTIPRGIDLSAFKKPAAPRSASLGRKGQSPPIQIITVARAIEKKGIHVLIEALAKLPKDLAVKVVYIGDGPVIESLKKLAQDLKVDHLIEFRGFQSPDKITQAMQEADIQATPFVQLSEVKTDNVDGLPVCILEAAATGLPTITTDAGGSTDFVENQKNGLVVKQNDSTALADAIVRLAQHPTERLQHGEQAAQDVYKYYDYRTAQLPLLALVQDLAKKNREKSFTLINWLERHAANVSKKAAPDDHKDDVTSMSTSPLLDVAESPPYSGLFSLIRSDTPSSAHSISPMSTDEDDESEADPKPPFSSPPR